MSRCESCGRKDCCGDWMQEVIIDQRDLLHEAVHLFSQFTRAEMGYDKEMLVELFILNVKKKEAEYNG